MKNLFLSLLLSLPGAAFAAGQDASITLLHGNSSATGALGIPVHSYSSFGHLRAGLLTDYVRDPLIYLENGLDKGALIAQRSSAQLSLEVDLAPRFGVHFLLPFSGQWSSEVPTMSRDTLGIGDMQVGGQLVLWNAPGIESSARATLFIPSSSDNAWIGEESVRGTMKVAGKYSRDQLELLAATGVHFRQSVNTRLDFILGNEFLADVGVRYQLWPDKYALGATLVSRTGTINIGNGGAESTSELLTYTELNRGSHRLQIGLGKALSSGYGSPEFHAFVNVLSARKPRRKVEDIVIDPTPPPQPVVIDDPPIIETSWEEEELAKVEADKIIIRDAIRFELGTDKIRTESLPTLDFVAQLINSDVQIGHVVIEGHASEEGSHEYNYDLSNLRARAIFKSLVQSNVHPDRLSHRGYGEALPIKLGQEESELAENRRVEFHIIRQDSPDTVPTLRELQSAPWSESKLDPVVPSPVKPQPDEPVFRSDEGEENVFDDSQGDLIDEEMERSPEPPVTDEPEEKP